MGGGGGGGGGGGVIKVAPYFTLVKYVFSDPLDPIAHLDTFENRKSLNSGLELYVAVHEQTE